MINIKTALKMIRVCGLCCCHIDWLAGNNVRGVFEIRKFAERMHRTDTEFSVESIKTFRVNEQCVSERASVEKAEQIKHDDIPPTVQNAELNTFP